MAFLAIPAEQLNTAGVDVDVNADADVEACSPPSVHHPTVYLEAIDESSGLADENFCLAATSGLVHVSTGLSTHDNGSKEGMDILNGCVCT